MIEQALVADVQRFSLHDGPGIRTTVFLKGCPLACVWCHNPEMISGKPELRVFSDRCNDCSDCVDVCPQSAHVVDELGGHRLERSGCSASGRCVHSCASAALKLVGERRSVSSILEEVLRDRSYYDRSGGGLTLSGGEPMRQWRFALRLLKAAKQNGIHTCLDTCGYALPRAYAAITPWVDLFLFDYKATGALRHRLLTGRDQRLILENLDALCRAGANIVLRCPLVPGVNDDDEHLAAIARLAARYRPIRSVQLMAFHDLGRAKAQQVGRRSEFEAAPADAGLQERWLSTLRGLGCDSAKLG